MKAVQFTANQNHPNVTQFRGISVRETTNATGAVVEFHEGTVGGALLATVGLSAGESVTATFDDRVLASSGVYVEVVSGTVTGVLYADD